MGMAPHRKGRPFNRAEYDALKAEMMMELLDPGRPKAMPSGVLSDKAAADVRALEHFATHPEMQVRSGRPCDLQMVVVSVLTQPAPGAYHLTCAAHVTTTAARSYACGMLKGPHVCQEVKR